MSATTPTVSVVMAAYQATKTIEATIESVRAQTMREWELIVVDDGSSDDTADRVDALAADDARIRLVRSLHVGHIGVLRNHGVTLASGRLLSFLDADDLWHPDFLERVVAAIDEHGAAVGHCGATHLVGDREESPAPRYDGPTVCPPGELLGRFGRTSPIYSGAALIDTEVFRSAGGFSEASDLFSALDFDLWLRLAPHHRFVYVPERLFRYRVSSGSLSFSTANHLRTYRGAVAALQAALDRPELAGHRHRDALRAQQARFARHLAVLLIADAKASLRQAAAATVTGGGVADRSAKPGARLRAALGRIHPSLLLLGTRSGG